MWHHFPITTNNLVPVPEMEDICEKKRNYKFHTFYELFPIAQQVKKPIQVDSVGFQVKSDLQVEKCCG